MATTTNVFVRRLTTTTIGGCVRRSAAATTTPRMLYQLMMNPVVASSTTPAISHPMTTSTLVHRTTKFPQQQQQKQQMIIQRNLISQQPVVQRYFSAAATEQASEEPTAATVPVTFIYPDGEEVEVQAEIGKHLLAVAHDCDIDLEGACGGELACATCHLVFEQDIYDTLPEKLEEEEDMLDLAYDLTDTSRLGCQIKVTEEMAGMRLHVPEDGV